MFVYIIHYRQRLGDNMDYLNIYNQLILKRKNTTVDSETYTEVHHIIPRCMGGTDNKDNLVVLTAREHYIAHELLFRHYKTSKLAHAWFAMLRNGRGQERHFTSKQYERAKTNRSTMLSEDMKGENNHFFNKTHTDETKRKISEANKGRVKSESEISNWVEKVAKKPKSEEHRNKIGRKGFVMLQNKETLEIVRISREEAKRLNDDIWVNPRKITPEKRHKCEYCGVETNAGNLKRWHNEKCKHKQSNQQ